LFFGFFVPLFRGDIKSTIIQLILVSITAGISQLFFPFSYNKTFLKGLLIKGYVTADERSAKILEIESI
jgi:hypothetical protein